MKAVLVRSLDDIAIVEMEAPRPGPGEIVVAMKVVGICGSDTTPWYVATKAPVVLGHEPSGVVAETGAGVTSFHAGDRVVVHHHAACGACRFCSAGEDVMCAEWKRARLHPGGLAEFVRVEAAAVVTDTLRFQDSLSFEDGALVEPLACAVKAVRRAHVASGDSVAVIGLGANGILLGLVSKARGCSGLVGCDPDPARRAHALRLGFDRAIAPGDALGENDVVFVLPTAEEAFHAALASAAPAARIVFYSPIEGGKIWRLEPHSAYLRDLSLLFSYSCGAADMREALGLLARGAVRSADLVTHRVPLERAAEAFALARRGGDVLKVVVTF
ncbi:MAG TPA: alcohol dehydrogenase catalytic domain-containing protein [Thermoanaerobaculia bacterium]|jgi:L-iditol 2-dehydrogenase